MTNVKELNIIKMNSDEELLNTYKSLLSMIDVQKFQVSSPLDTMMFKGNDYERYERERVMVAMVRSMTLEVTKKAVH